MIDKLLEKSIKKISKDDNVAVLLSGGVDSISVAFSLHRLGRHVKAYTFHLEGMPSYDAQKAVEICKIMNWDYHVTVVPIDNLKQDFFTLLNEIKCERKTHFECTFPFLYVYPNITETEVLSGWAADGYYGLSKKACLHYKSPKSKFDEFRNDYFQPNNTAGRNWHERVANKYGKKFLSPYLDDDIKKYFYQFDWYQLNKPYEKHLVVESFPEFKTIGKFKKHTNLQLGSGINKIFEKILDDAEINFKKRSRVMDVCRDWKNKII